MSTRAIVVYIVGALVAATVALIVGYLHRKQMRQIEAFRLDPSVGLKPPDTWLWRRFKEHWHWLGILGPIYSFASFTLRSGSPSRREIAGAIITFGILVAWGLSMLFFAFMGKVFQMFAEVANEATKNTEEVRKRLAAALKSGSQNASSE